MAKARASQGNTAEQAASTTNAGEKPPEITVRTAQEFADVFKSTGIRTQIHPFEIAENADFLTALRSVDFSALEGLRLTACYRLQNTTAEDVEERKQQTFLVVRTALDNLAEIIPEAVKYYIEQKNTFTNPLKANFPSYSNGETVEMLLSGVCPTFDGRAQRAAGEGKLSKQDTAALENLQNIANDNPATVIQLLETALTANKVLNNLKPVLLRRYETMLAKLIAARDA